MKNSVVWAIRWAYRDRATNPTKWGSYRLLARRFRVSHMTIARIVRGETYRGVV